MNSIEVLCTVLKESIKSYDNNYIELIEFVNSLKIVYMNDDIKNLLIKYFEINPIEEIPVNKNLLLEWLEDLREFLLVKASKISKTQKNTTKMLIIK
jgi:hypothetical protein